LRADRSGGTQDGDSFHANSSVTGIGEGWEQSIMKNSNADGTRAFALTSPYEGCGCSGEPLLCVSEPFVERPYDRRGED
jgi:hypothetical protein